MQIPDLFSVRTALERALFECLTDAFQQGLIVFVQPADEMASDLKKIQVIHAVNPGDTQEGELGCLGVFPRVGGYTVTLSCPADNTKTLAEGWKLCSVLENYFCRKDIPISDACEVMCDEPYTTNVGEQDSRLALSVTIPWWVWSGRQEGE